MNGPGLQSVPLVDLGYDQTRAASWRGSVSRSTQALGGTQWRQRAHPISRERVHSSSCSLCVCSSQL